MGFNFKAFIKNEVLPLKGGSNRGCKGKACASSPPSLVETGNVYKTVNPPKIEPLMTFIKQNTLQNVVKTRTKSGAEKLLFAPDVKKSIMPIFKGTTIKNPLVSTQKEQSETKQAIEATIESKSMFFGWKSKVLKYAVPLVVLLLLIFGIRKLFFNK